VKFLADMGVSMTTVSALRQAGHDVVHLREEGLITLPDEGILNKANQEQRVILTFDLDFGELLAAGGGVTPSVVLFRMRNQTPAEVTPRLFRVLFACDAAIDAGAIVIVEDQGYRIRRLPIRRGVQAP
jgi:predicted nuclease of predicted toxin-antitoxin system